jgi:uncharacterized membrane protein
MLDSVTQLLVEYYLTPGYNIVNTLTYGIVLGLLVFKLIPRLRPLLGRIDLRFMLMLTPFILYGATVRELVDQGLGVYAGHTEFPGNYFLVAPGIYATMFVLTFSIILAALGVRRVWGGDYRLCAGAAGSVLFLYNLTLIIPNIINLGVFTTVCVFFLISGVFLYALKRLAALDYLDFEGNFIIALVHLFDASTTFVGVDLIGHTEKHVVPTFFINVFGTAAVMYPLKLLVLLPALYMIDDEMAGDEFGRRFVKLVIIVLGAGPAVRNSILLLLG